MERCLQKKKTSERRASPAKGRKRRRPLNQMSLACSLHSEYTVVRRFDRRVESRAQGDGDSISGIDRIEDAVVPNFRGRVVRTRLTPIVFQNGIANCCKFFFGQFLPVPGGFPYFYIGKSARRLPGPHSETRGLGPGEHEAGVKGAPR